MSIFDSAKHGTHSYSGYPTYHTAVYPVHRINRGFSGYFIQPNYTAVLPETR